MPDSRKMRGKGVRCPIPVAGDIAQMPMPAADLAVVRHMMVADRLLVLEDRGMWEGIKP